MFCFVILKETALAGALLQAVWAACPARAVSNVPAPAPPPSVGAGTPQRCHRYHHADCCHRDRNPNQLWSPVIPPGWRVRTMLRGGDSCSQHGKPILRWLSGHGSLVPGTLLTGIFLGWLLTMLGYLCWWFCFLIIYRGLLSLKTYWNILVPRSPFLCYCLGRHTVPGIVAKKNWRRLLSKNISGQNKEILNNQVWSSISDLFLPTTWKIILLIWPN